MARGPGYPYINLEHAVRLAAETYKYARRAPAPLDAVTKDAWGYSPTSSSGIKVATAMKYFGLTESAENNNVRLTDRGYRIVMDTPESEERKKAVREAALSPRWYEYCWKTWGKDMPPSMRQALIFDHHFIPTTVDGFLKDYKKTIEFAGLASDDNQQNSLGEEDEFGKNGEEEKNKEGDLPELGRKPINDSGFQKSPARNEKMRQDIFSMSEGAVSIEWPSTLSKESFEDLIDWLKILERKIKRSVVETTDQDLTKDG